MTHRTLQKLNNGDTTFAAYRRNVDCCKTFERSEELTLANDCSTSAIPHCVASLVAQPHSREVEVECLN